MQAMILAAGRGERLRPITDSIPKPLITVGRRTLIEHHLHRLSKLGFNHVVINVSYLGEKIMSFLDNGSRYGLQISYSIETDGALGTAGGIVNALKYLDEDPILVINSDVFTNFDYSQIQIADSAKAHIILVPNPQHHLDGDYCLTGGLVQLPGSVPQFTYTFSGIGLYRKSMFESIAFGKCELAWLFKKLIQNGNISGALHESLWIDVGNAERLLQARSEANTQSA